MKRNAIFLISLLVLTACAATAPEGARVRPIQGQPYEPSFPDNSGAVKAYALQDSPVQAPQSNEVGFLGSQQPQQIPTEAPVFPAPSSSNWPATTTGNATPQATFPAAPTATAPAIPAPNSGVKTAAATPPAPAAPVAQTPPAAPSGGNAVKVLLDDARKAVQENRLDKAASSLERAVRLEPRNASIWYDLAQIRLHQKNYAAAEQMANKSISFTKNEDLIKRNRQIIAAAQSARSAGN
ncbi:tetratricopeptide repeat protein [Ignatzschineria cameli]|uniref:Uncharacterized protein n=1 Tax=Ignatzschineria cameli TaxID=2182793 RepID=A0A2U2AR65_9GAMM|nr:tetratricopeptide repeat protein [Ignatzschineria cameli]PWD85221.1 hypothetical protein DC080_06045 [Ignatzschineria cameli]PWD86353.1 hypothetical protein DC077_06350 [Ignatzschineria cameli]PWD89809.1 hypothetical protein DC079_05580 [Ignatzschineria cameli]PWD91459.1 hypothetical protein DC081_05290 [Ignatzschineria cameli]PWD92497.1 hypothetical protein DC078_05575 [Ignatzschineria cameli]